MGTSSETAVGSAFNLPASSPSALSITSFAFSGNASLCIRYPKTAFSGVTVKSSRVFASITEAGENLSDSLTTGLFSRVFSSIMTPEGLFAPVAEDIG